MHENLNDLERSLQLLTPAPARIDRDEVLFRAGQTSAARRLRVWQFAAAACALIAAGVGFAWWRQPAPEPTVRLVHLPAPVSEAPSPLPLAPPSRTETPPLIVADASPLVGSSYLARQRQLLRWGLDGLEGLPPEAGRPRAPEIQRGNSSRRSLFPGWPFAFTGDD